MIWKFFPLADTDHRAKAHVLKNIEAGAHEHALSKKLLLRFSAAGGPMVLIAYESLDLDSSLLYDDATYAGGQVEAPGWNTVPWTDSPTWGLIDFLDGWLGTSDRALVVCENPFLTRQHLANAPRESRTCLYGDNVYHLLGREDFHARDAIESAIREWNFHWGTGVCASHVDIPEGEIPSERFFDEIAATTAHIFVPALDGAGYILWSPESPETP
jgi:hypothetical protein